MSNSKVRADRKHIKHRKTKDCFPKITGRKRADSDKPALKKIMTTHVLCVKCNSVAPLTSKSYSWFNKVVHGKACIKQTS